MDQFVENFGIISQGSFEKIKKIKILIVGLGGLGGYLANTLIRLGVSHLFLVDYDLFSVSNMNRQLFSNQKTISKSKVIQVKEELILINPNANIKIFDKRIEDIKMDEYKDIDIIFDAVDHIPTKIFLESLATKLNVPLIHGAIGGYFGQIGVIMPNEYILKEIYQSNHGIEQHLRSPSFTPPIISNMMCVEFVKWIEQKDFLKNQIMMIDLLNYSFQIMIKKG